MSGAGIAAPRLRGIINGVRLRRFVFGLSLWAAVLSAQSRWYPFGIEQDELEGAPDFSHLNRPLQPADRIFVRDGHFYRVGPDLMPNTDDDERVRFFGLNFCFGANFPEERDASRIARRLRKLGVNLVRLHHMDSQPDSNPDNAGSTLTRGPYPSWNTVALRRLRAFLDALAAEGIYVNVNLHVGYQFRPSVDGVPPHPSFPSQSKPCISSGRVWSSCKPSTLAGCLRRSLCAATRCSP